MLYTVKHLGYFNHILGCPSCIRVTKECYQMGDNTGTPEQVRKSWTTLNSRGNKVRRIICHEFRVVQLFRTCSNHSTTGNQACSGVWHEFEPLVNLLEPLSSRGNKVHTIICHVPHSQTGHTQLSGSRRFGRVEPMSSSDSRRFSWVEAPQTHVQLLL